MHTSLVAETKKRIHAFIVGNHPVLEYMQTYAHTVSESLVNGRKTSDCNNTGLEQFDTTQIKKIYKDFRKRKKSVISRL